MDMYASQHVDMGALSAEDIRSSEECSRLLKVLGNEKDVNLNIFKRNDRMKEGGRRKW